MSFLSTNPGEEKKTALKLLNKYADSYNSIIQENIFLKSEIKDLRDNLKLNKEIIKGFFSNNKNNNKIDNFINQYKQENDKLYEQNYNLSKKIENLISKFSLNEQLLNETINQLRNENDKIQAKIFFIEQKVKKKDNIIKNQNKKLDELKYNFTLIDKEIFISEPSNAVLKLNDELLYYKDLYFNFSKLVKKCKGDIFKYKNKIQTLETENQNLRNQYKTHIFSINKERDKLIFEIKKNKKDEIENGLLKKINYINKRNKTENNEEINYRKFENEEFLEICKNVGLTKKKFEKLSKENQYSQLTETIELLFKLLVDRNITINLLEKENDNLNKKNFKLNKENMDLFNENLDLKEQINKIKENFFNLNNKTTNFSSENSLKTNCNNDKIKNTIINYEKFINEQQLEKQRISNYNNKKEIDSANDAEDELSHNSIIDLKKNKEIKLNESNRKSNQFNLIKTINFNDKKDEDSIISDTKTTENNNKEEENNNNNKEKIENFGMTIGTVTSSEFREGCKGIDTFLLTIKQNIKNNGNEIKENKINLLNENHI